NGATVTATAGSGTISFSTPQLGILATCLVSVNVTGTTAGAKVNTVVVSSQSAGTSTAAATLTVNQLSSSTALVSSLNPSNSGQA
ncbi:UNVERIFIED_CONTAM: hypothetical protein NY603_34105, partial [Bacteroidetes bacterium 56_B9]